MRVARRQVAVIGLHRGHGTNPEASLSTRYPHSEGGACHDVGADTELRQFWPLRRLGSEPGKSRLSSRIC